MKVLNGSSIEEKCVRCGLGSDIYFCDLPREDLERLGSIKVSKNYLKGEMLFVEGQPAGGVYMLCQGKVKLSTCSEDGKVIIIGIAEPGDLIGLSAVLAGTEYEVSAEVMEVCRADFVPAGDILRFLAGSPRASLNAARQLNRSYRTAYTQVCSLGSSDKVAGKLAKLVLGWTGNGHGGNGRVEIKNSFTHEEIAEMVGSSRETVTRALKYFREQKLITIKGSSLVIHDRQRLKAVVQKRRTGSRRMQSFLLGVD
jgi:CRP/FNR family transcriptional regulator, cyclic AMP receptor protein